MELTTHPPGYTVTAVLKDGMHMSWLRTPHKELAIKDAQIALKTLRREGISVVYAGVWDNAQPDAGVLYAATPANTL